MYDVTSGKGRFAIPNVPERKSGKATIMRNLINTSKQWDSIASRHIEAFFTLYPKFGAKIKEILEKYEIKPRRILEIAAFSAKDSRYLASAFPACEFYAIDFSQEATRRATKVNTELEVKNLHILRANAFNLPFKDSSFDISFHSGFYTYVRDNSDLSKLFEEQKRVTKNLIVISGYNKYTPYALLYWYLANIKRDPWYKIRRYSVKELNAIFANEKIAAIGGVESWALQLVDSA